MSYLPTSLGTVNVMLLLYILAIVVCIGILLTAEWIIDAWRHKDDR